LFVAKKLIPKLLTLLLSFCLMPLFGQEYRTGAILDPVGYEQTEAKPALLSRSCTPTLTLAVRKSRYKYCDFSSYADSICTESCC